MWKFNIATEKWSLETDNPDPINSESKYSSANDLYPVKRSGHGMIHIPDDNIILIFGGRKSKNADGDLNDLWEYDIDRNEWVESNRG